MKASFLLCTALFLVSCNAQNEDDYLPVETNDVWGDHTNSASSTLPTKRPKDYIRIKLVYPLEKTGDDWVHDRSRSPSSMWPTKTARVHRIYLNFLKGRQNFNARRSFSVDSGRTVYFPEETGDDWGYDRSKSPSSVGTREEPSDYTKYLNYLKGSNDFNSNKWYNLDSEGTDDLQTASNSEEHRPLVSTSSLRPAEVYRDTNANQHYSTSESFNVDHNRDFDLDIKPFEGLDKYRNIDLPNKINFDNDPIEIKTVVWKRQSRGSSVFITIAVFVVVCVISVCCKLIFKKKVNSVVLRRVIIVVPAESNPPEETQSSKQPEPPQEEPRPEQPNPYPSQPPPPYSLHPDPNPYRPSSYAPL